MSLQSEIRSLATPLAAAAQEELDSWAPNEDGHDEELGYGGACDAICQRLSDVIVSKITDVEISEGGQEGDDHAFVLCRRGEECVVVDIPAYLYEIGGGYSWRKRSEVHLTAGDVVIETIDLPREIQ